MSKEPVAKNFKAWRDEMPVSSHRLHVKGEVHANTGGWSATLREAVPGGINPTILILELTVAAPTGPVTEALEVIPVEFSKDQGGAYESVQIRGLGDDFTIPVDIVH